MTGIHLGWRAALLLLALVACRSQPPAVSPAAQGASSPPPTTVGLELKAGLPGMPPYDPKDVYAFTRAGRLSPAVKGFPERVYVPDGKTNRLYVIDPATFRVIAEHPMDAEPQHVVPSYDLKTLYVANDVGDTLIPIDPKTGAVGGRIRVKDPYNLYFTPDGRSAIVVAEYQRRLDFFDPHTWQPQGSLQVPCKGINHMDYSADGRTLVAACEFSGDLLRIDVAARKVLGRLHLGGMPQDVKLSPDGGVFYVADMMAGGCT
ncbi:YncE family protein [Meiothermus sp. Pnk-1]|uniref:YncE family protein n=1 Tax=Meiothermus sp. Pnk-1 TaxID=873128 RepID=UPI001F37803E|nr:YncE family protein [Meiothermus sp. Pnk-1]